MARKVKGPDLYIGPDPESETGWSMYDVNVEREEWEEAWSAYVGQHPELLMGSGAPDSSPLSADGRSRDHADPYEGDPVRKARFTEAVDYIRDYTGTWGFILDLRAHRAWGTKWFRLSDRQVEVVLNAKARDRERVERKATGLDLSGLPAGTTRYAVENAEGDLTFIRIDNVDSGKWADWVFVKQVVGGGDEPRLGAQRPGDAYKGSFESLLRKVLVDPEAAAIRYGLELGECARCGRTLTNAESRALGIGPECRQVWSTAA